MSWFRRLLNTPRQVQGWCEIFRYSCHPAGLHCSVVADYSSNFPRQHARLREAPRMDTVAHVAIGALNALGFPAKDATVISGICWSWWCRLWSEVCC